MRNAALIFASALLAAALALLAYHFLVGRKQQEELAGAVAELARGQQQMRKTLDQTQETLKAATDRESQLIREDLQAVAAMRVAIAEYYLTNDRMPETQAEVGLPPPEQYRGKSLKSMTLQPGGAIELVFDANSGVDGGRIRLIADVSRVAAMGIQWRCETSDYPQIQRIVPTCEYRPRSPQTVSSAAAQTAS